MLDISLHTGAMIREFGLEEGYQRIADVGFTAIDWSLPKAWSLTETSKTGRIPQDSYMLWDFEDIKEFMRPRLEAVRRAGLIIGQSHAPGARFFSNNPLLTADRIKAYSNAIRICEWAECPYLIIHPLNRPMDDELTYEEIFDRNITLFSGLIPQLKASGVKVCLENTIVHKHEELNRCAMYLDNPYDVNRLLDTLNEMADQECFAFCLDTGHLNMTKKTPREYINILGHRLQTLHLHDNYMTIDNHYGPKHGTVDWDEVIGGLRDVGYRGNINFETCVMPYYDGLYRYGLEMRERILSE